MYQISLFCLLAVLAGAPTIAAPQPTTIANGSGFVGVGWTKKQVEEAIGKPSRASKDDNTWYYDSKGGTFTVKFKGGKVSSAGGAG